MTTTDLNLYRAVHKDNFPDGVVIDGAPAPGVLHPDFYARALKNGKVRKADVKLLTDEQNVEWVRTGGGTSLFDRSNAFGTKYWHYFDIPSGTEIPDSLNIRRTGYNEDYAAWHYQIECKANLMRKDAMQGALDNLARNAIARLVELAHH